MSAALPTGTVTFLFTDVEGSTRLLEDLGAEGYAVELGRHRDIVRHALGVHGGVEVDTQGDAFFCAFGSARGAVACAEAIRDDLEATPVRVRIGVHTGEALVVDRHYVGMDVHRAARIGACGHGGQVVVSPTTAALLEPGELPLIDLGLHRLKDLAAPVVLYQLGDREFPALKTLYRTNLPVPATPFLGREAELDALMERVSEPGVRLLTLTGPGGTGKTRLSLQLAAELADRYPDGIWWTPLASLRSGELVASAVAGVLDVAEEPGRPLADSIAGALGRRRLVLLLDNCEHLVAAAARLAASLVSTCPDLLVLATSREPLTVSGEHVFPVEPLAAHDASELFYARAWAVGARLDRDDDGPAVTELCARLDNLPLAVELAAARTPALPPAALLERLTTRLDVLTGPRDAEERQRTLRATISWSCELLEEPERRLFRRLGVFVGGASLPAVEAVCDTGLEELVSLVSKSLVRRAATHDGDPRYWMLETIRELAEEELEASGELEALRDRHLDWYADLSHAAGAVDVLAAGGVLAELEPDLPNLRAAFSWAISSSRNATQVLEVASALLLQHLARGRYAEAEEVARRTLDLDLGPCEAALFGSMLGVVLRVLGRPREALEAHLAAERLLDSVSRSEPWWWPRWIGVKLNQAHFFYMENDIAELERVIAELEPVVAEHGTSEHRLDLVHIRQQHRYRVERYVLSEETETLAREAYALDVAAGVPSADFVLGFCLLWRGKLDEAEAHLVKGREVARESGIALFETRCLVYGLVLRRKRCDVEGVRAHLVELEALDELHGYFGLVRANAAWLAWRDGDLERAARLGEEALADWRSEGRTGHGVFEWMARFPLLGVAVAGGDLDAASRHAGMMLDASQQPLPDELAAALESGAGDSFAQALELARAAGYA